MIESYIPANLPTRWRDARDATLEEQLGDIVATVVVAGSLLVEARLAREPEPDASLIRVLVQGHDWFQRLLSGEARTLADIASAEGVSDRYVRRLIDLAFLAPDITAAILDGTQPVDLTAERVSRFGDLPLAWSQQERVLGFA